MVNDKRKIEDIISAVTGSRGIKMVIAKKLDVHRHTVDRYIDKHKKVAEAYNNEIESFGDVVEMVIIQDIENKRNVETAKWYARMKLGKRGYIEKQQVEHGGSIAAPQTYAEWVKIETERAKK